MLTDLSFDILEIIYRKLDYYLYKNNFIIVLISQKKNQRMRSFYNWNTPNRLLRIIINKKLFSISCINDRFKKYYISTYINSYKEISDELCHPNRKMMEKYVIWKGDKVIKKNIYQKVNVGKSFWNQKLDELKVAKDFIFCDGTPTCWRCTRKLEKPNLLPNNLIIYRNTRNIKYLGEIISYNSKNSTCCIKVFTNFNTNGEKKFIIKNNISIKYLFNPPMCWFSHLNWVKSNIINNNGLLHKFNPLSEYEYVDAKNQARTAMAIIHLNSIK